MRTNERLKEEISKKQLEQEKAQQTKTQYLSRKLLSKVALLSKSNKAEAARYLEWFTAQRKEHQQLEKWVEEMLLVRALTR